MGCEPRANLLQRAEILSGQTEEIQSQEEHHRAENVNASGKAARLQEAISQWMYQLGKK